MPAWVAVDAHLEDHPKFHTFRRSVGLSELEAIGALVRLWSLARTMRPDGQLDGYSLQTIDDVLRIPGAAKAFVEAGYIALDSATSRYTICSWGEWNGQFLKDAQRKRKERKKKENRDRPRTVRGPAPIILPEQEQEQEQDPEHEKNRKLSSPSGDAWAAGFFKAWSLYPHYGRRSSKAKSAARWAALRPRPVLEAVISGLSACVASDDWTREGGRFVPAMEVWIAKRGWDSSNGVENGSAPDPLANVRRLIAEKERAIASTRST